MAEEKTYNPELFKNLPTLETERLVLRKLAVRDANDVYEYASDPEVSKHLIWEPHRSVEDSLKFIRETIKIYENGLPSSWGIVYKENNKVIGAGGFHWWLEQHGKAEIGYAISARYWNRGIMTEALGEIIKFGFEQMKLHRAEARIYIENAASDRVLIKCGMVYEGMLRESLFVKGKFRDFKMFSILEDEYKKIYLPQGRRK